MTSADQAVPAAPADQAAPAAPADQAAAFHAHLANCARCSRECFNLCATGAALLESCARGATVPPPAGMRAADGGELVDPGWAKPTEAGQGGGR